MKGMILKDDYTRNKLIFDKTMFRLLKELKKVYAESQKQKNFIKTDKTRDGVASVIRYLAYNESNKQRKV
jgi:hypothetical protein